MAGSKQQRTLVFCTAYAPTQAIWQARYRTWITGIQQTSLRYEQILLVDDASPVRPRWSDVRSVASLAQETSSAPVVLHHFQRHLGNEGRHLGWARSFFYAAWYARWNGFDKVVHVESDAFLITARLCEYFNEVADQWVMLWCPRHAMPESGIQVIAGAAFERFCELANHGYTAIVGRTAERGLPADLINRDFVGDRYGDYTNQVPRDADFAMQARVDLYSPRYLWWLPSAATIGNPTVPADDARVPQTVTVSAARQSSAEPG